MAVLGACSKDSSVISHDEMSQIIVEMLVRDQWLNSHFEERDKADSTFVYGTIIEEFGYDRDEFNESVSFYVDHPAVFTKILEKSISLLDGRQIALENFIEQQEHFKTDSLARIDLIAAVKARLEKLPAPKWSMDDSLALPEPHDRTLTFISPVEKEQETDSMKIVVPYIRGGQPSVPAKEEEPAEETEN